MRRARDSVLRLLPIVALVAVAACSANGGTVKVDDQTRECSAILSASRQVVLIDPREATDADVTRNEAAVATLDSVATGTTTEVGPDARALAATAKFYVEALKEHKTERATANEGLMRQQAVPIAEKCGYGERADLVLGTTSGPESEQNAQSSTPSPPT